MDRRSGKGAAVPPASTSEQGATGGVSRRQALGVVGVSAAGVLLPATAAEADAGAGTGASAPKNVPANLTDAQVAVIAAVARTMASVPVILPYRAGRDLHPLDRVNEGHIRTLAGHQAPAQAILTHQGIDTLAAAGIGSATPSAIASAIAAHTEWDADAGVNAALLLATATATPLGFSDAFPHAWRALLRSRSWPMIASIAPKEAS